MRWSWMKFSVFALALIVTGSANSRDLVVDLSSPVVQIRTDFAGTHLLLFGAKRGAGDVIIVVRGPIEDQVVRKKARTFGIWVNRDQVAFEDVPSFYAVASNRPLAEMLDAATRDTHQIGLDTLHFTEASGNISEEESAPFRDALIRNKERQELYSVQDDSLLFVNDMLFRTDLWMPSNVSVGAFSVETYLIEDGRIVNTHTTNLGVRKFGIEADVYRFAYDYSLLYGIAAVLIACFAGWLANAAFRRA